KSETRRSKFSHFKTNRCITRRGNLCKSTGRTAYFRTCWNTSRDTKLGYLLSGKICAPPLQESIVNSSLNDQLSELWKLEEVPKTNAKIQTPDPCEESFSKSVKREIMKVDILLIFHSNKILSVKAKKKPYNYRMP
ncbi:hypothetical protein TNCV_4086791, partial [Trichonephila clavipes]